MDRESKIGFGIVILACIIGLLVMYFVGDNLCINPNDKESRSTYDCDIETYEWYQKYGWGD